MAISWSAGVFSRTFPNKDKEWPGWLGPLPNSTLGVVEGDELSRMQFEERMKRAEEAHHAEIWEADRAPKTIIPTQKASKANVGHSASSGYWDWLRWRRTGTDSQSLEKDVGDRSLPTPNEPTDKPKPTGRWINW